jgi:single-stranded-DNA-specific exonuclease
MEWKKINQCKKGKDYKLSKIFSIDQRIITYLDSLGLKNEKQISQFLYPKIGRITDVSELEALRKVIRVLNQAIMNNRYIRIICENSIEGIFTLLILCKVLSTICIKFEITFLDEHSNYEVKPRHISDLNVNEQIIFFIGKIDLDEVLIALIKKNNLIAIALNDQNESLTVNDISIKESNFAESTFYLRLLEAYAHNTTIDDFDTEIISCCISILAGNNIMLDDNRIITTYGVELLNRKSNKLFEYLRNRLNLHKYTYTNIENCLIPLLENIKNFSGINELYILLNSNNVNKGRWNKHIRLNNKRNKKIENLVQESYNIIESRNDNNKFPVIVVGDFPIHFQEDVVKRITNRYSRTSIVLDKIGNGSIQIHPKDDKDQIYNNLNRFCLFDSYNKKLKLKPNHYFYQDIINTFENINLTNRIKDGYNFKYLDTICIRDFPNNLLEDICLLEPFGKGNPTIKFKSTSVIPTNVTKVNEDIIILEFNDTQAFFINRYGYYRKLLLYNPIDIIYCVHSFKPNVLFKIIDIKFK